MISQPANPPDHDHLPLTGGQQTMFVTGINTGNGFTVTVTGDGHTHDVMITGPQAMTLRTGGSVMATSSNANGHTHVYTITC